MNIIKYIFFAALLFPAISLSFDSLDRCDKKSSYCIFVSLSGVQDSSGELNSPLNSLIGARNKARQIRKSDAQANIYIYLRGGEYHLNESMVLGNEYDAGAGDTEWTAFPGENVILSGAARFHKKFDFYGPGIYRVGVASGIIPRELYVNGERLVRARWPNNPKKSVIKYWYGGKKSPTDTDIFDRKITIENKDLPILVDFRGVELHLEREFSRNILKINSFNRYDDVSHFFFGSEDEKIIFDQKFPRKWSRQSFHLEGSIDLLDHENEWFINNLTKEIYVFLENDPCGLQGECEYYFPAVQSIFRIVGFSKNPFKNIVISNIKFKYSGWNGAIDGYVPSQAGVYSVVNGNKKIVPGVIDLTYVDGVEIKNCVFDSIGTHAIVANKGVSNLIVNNNYIVNGSAGGIYLDTNLMAAPAKHDVVKNIIIKNNVIKKIGLVYDDAVAIFSGYAGNVKIHDNYIEDIPYSAISVGWGWTNELTILGNNLIANNFIRGSMKNLTDGGGIYLLSRQDNTIVENNYILLNPSQQSSDFDFIAGVYLDKGVSGVVVKNNFVEIFGGNQKSRHLKYFDQTGNVGNIFTENK